MSLRSLSLVVALAFVRTPALAATFVVDAANGPGANFTDIAPAIAAVQPGDLLLVRPGAYSAFTVDKALTILATTNNTATSAGLAIQNTALGQRVVVAGVTPLTASVTNCAGTVIFQNMTAVLGVTVASSRDVRLDTVRIQPLASATPVHALVATASRIELSNSGVLGSLGCDGCSVTSGGNGVVATNARLHIAGGFITGGRGSSVMVPSAFAGNGGIGVRLAGTASLCATHTRIDGGLSGINDLLTECTNDGVAGIALDLAATSGPNRFSATTIFNPLTFVGSFCDPAPSPPTYNGPNVQPVVQDPQLRLMTTPAAGTMQTFRVVGTSGTRAIFWLSREDTLVAGAPGEVELLVPRGRFFRPGKIPPSGTLQFSIFLPATIPQGTVFVAQAETIPTSGVAQRSNSTVLVVR